MGMRRLGSCVTQRQRRQRDQAQHRDCHRKIPVCTPLPVGCLRVCNFAVHRRECGDTIGKR
jgi:hypothetical protein